MRRAFAVVVGLFLCAGPAQAKPINVTAATGAAHRYAHRAVADFGASAVTVSNCERTSRRRVGCDASFSGPLRDPNGSTFDGLLIRLSVWQRSNGRLVVRDSWR